MLEKARIFSVPFGLSFWSQSILVLVTALLSLVDDAIIPCLDVFELLLLLLIELFVYQELFFLFDVLSPFLSRPVVALVFIIFFFIIYSIWRVFSFLLTFCTVVV